MRGGSAYLWASTFFGLTSKYQEGVYEELFVLKHHGGWSFFEAYNLPIQLRRWFVNRLIDEFEKESKAMKESSAKSKSSKKSRSY